VEVEEEALEVLSVGVVSADDIDIAPSELEDEYATSEEANSPEKP